MLQFENFALQEQLEDNLMVSISRVWYNCSYTMAAKPIKSLELHYTMIQFLIIAVIQYELLNGPYLLLYNLSSIQISSFKRYKGFKG